MQLWPYLLSFLYLCLVRFTNTGICVVGHWILGIDDTPGYFLFDLIPNTIKSNVVNMDTNSNTGFIDLFIAILKDI